MGILPVLLFISAPVPGWRGWKRQMHGLWWDGPMPGPELRVRVSPGQNSVAIQADGPVKGLSVLLDSSELDLDREVHIVVNGEVAWKGTPERSLGALVRTAGGFLARCFAHGSMCPPEGEVLEHTPTPLGAGHTSMQSN
ncbi:MAG: hypothetical protein AAF492_21100 [Verrucomicrobiota bacterium]